MNELAENITPLPTQERRTQPLKNCVEVALQLYFQKLNGNSPVDLYKMVIGEAEYGLLKNVMEFTQGNQSKAAEYLGINRGTLRKKLKEHNLN